MLIFLIHLVNQLDLERPSWKEETILLLDGAKYHTGSRVREYLRKLELQVIWSGPFSYSTAPIEMVFGILKFGELNPDKKATGKKFLHLVAAMIGAKLQQTPRSTFIRLWHHTTLNLYKYLYFEHI
jgi:hypothetical protein